MCIFVNRLDNQQHTRAYDNCGNLIYQLTVLGQYTFQMQLDDRKCAYYYEKCDKSSNTVDKIPFCFN